MKVVRSFNGDGCIVFGVIKVSIEVDAVIDDGDDDDDSTVVVVVKMFSVDVVCITAGFNVGGRGTS